MPVMIEQAGIDDSNVQLLLNAINPIFCLIAAIAGSALLDKLGRRKMMLIGLTGAIISYSLMTAFTAESANTPSLSYGTIVFIYIFGIFFSLGVCYPSPNASEKMHLLTLGLFSVRLPVQS